MKKLNISDIDFSINYQGYYWYSNSKHPIVILNDKISEQVFSTLPFIVEANFYSKECNISISIKNIDGIYLFHQVNFSDIKKNQCTVDEYLVHNLEGISKIKMLQYWEESEQEELLENMSTLVPSWIAFIGFVNKQYI
ncbi:MAG: TIGR04423 family type III CRISPR-associated protein [Chitinophagaceae bacterium]|nr:TIGR04423 family type III CRISPR-associated protein [Chitinophagaceae bacterium]